ncbi:MAG TPA: phosphoesterase [Verrucomicrobiales bacterium]|nr:phosphoesterase [Verrucomicrobiales bacterium]
MENHDWDTILGSTFCPYINNTLLPRASYASRYVGVPGLHPSEPNYLWLVTGTNFNIRNDDLPSLNHQSSTNTLFHLLDAAGISWKSYQEDIKGTSVPDVNAGEYVARHNPPMFFDSIRTNVAYTTNHVRPYTELAADLASGKVPAFCFISPNLTNIMHDTTPGSPSSRKQGDDWLSREMPKILGSQAYSNGGAVFITWDEGSNDGDAPIGMILLSPRARGGGYHNSIEYTHSSWLRTAQDIFGVRPYLGDAAFAPGLSDLFKTLRIKGVTPTATGLNFEVENLIPGRSHSLQSTSDLEAGVWESFDTWVPDTETATLLEPSPPAAGPRFYRVVESP